MNDLEKAFHKDMENIYFEAKKLKYNASYFWQLVCEKGGYETAKQLIHTDKPSEGFTSLWERNSLGLSVEAHVLRDKYVSLFTDEERAVCRNRLVEYGYPFDSISNLGE